MLWHDGKISSSLTKSVDLADRGLLLGDGLFETLPAFNGVPYLLGAHLERMRVDAECLRFPDGAETMTRAVHELAAADSAPCSIRVTMTRGTGPRGLSIPDDPTPFIFATRTPWSPDMAFGEMRLQTASIRRNATSPLSTMKTLSYLDHVLAITEARAKAADDALMLSMDGRVASTSMANVFVLSGRTLSTPRRQDAILPGVMRARILELVASIGLEPVERALVPDDLYRADLVFSTNSLRLMTRISALDGAGLDNRAEPIWQALQNIVQTDIRNSCREFEFA